MCFTDEMQRGLLAVGGFVRRQIDLGYRAYDTFIRSSLIGLRHVLRFIITINPFRTAVPLWGHTGLTLSSLSRTRD